MSEEAKTQADEQKRLEEQAALKQQLKEMEDKKRKEALAKADVKNKEVEFNVWFASRSKRIPRHHYREVIKADFKSRGLGERATEFEYDEALTKYGVKLA